MKYLLVLLFPITCFANDTNQNKTKHKNREIYINNGTVNFEADLYNEETMYSASTSFTLKSYGITPTLGITNINSMDYYPYANITYAKTFFDFNVSITTQIQTDAFFDVETYYNPNLGYKYQNFTFNIGPYYADRNMSGDVNTVGIASVLTCDWNDVDLTVQYISGSNSVSIASVTMYYTIQDFQPYVGLNYVPVENPYGYLSFGINWQ